MNSIFANEDPEGNVLLFSDREGKYQIGTIPFHYQTKPKRSKTAIIITWCSLPWLVNWI